MKLVAFFFFVVIGCALTAEIKMKDKWRKLQEVQKQLRDVRPSLQNTEQLLRTPPQNIEDCCSLSALQCFRANLQLHFNMTDRRLSRFYRGLQNNITLEGVKSCDSENATSTCEDCHSHDQENATVFFNRLEDLLQKAINRLTPN